MNKYKMKRKSLGAVRRKRESSILNAHKNAGITMISLVVTIIVLLILAGVSLSLVVGENGLIQKTKDSKRKTDETISEVEKDKEDLEKELTGKFNNENITTAQYTLTVDAGIGTLNGDASYTGKKGSKITIPAPNPPDGYIVTLNPNYGTAVSTSLSSTYEFTNWKLDGGGAISGDSYTFGSRDAKIVAEYTQGSVTLPIPQRDGYTFIGWYSSATGAKKVADGGSKYTPTANTMLYAQWEQKVVTSTVTVNAGSGTLNGNSSYSGNAGSTITISNPTVPATRRVYFNYNDGTYTDKLGYSSFTFTGWSLSGGGSISGSTYTFGTSNGTLTAQYSQSAITLPTITRSGYTLKGWYTAASGGTKIGNAGATYKPTGASTDVYAQWEQNAVTSTVTVNAGSGTLNGNSSYSGNAGSTITISNPTVPATRRVYFNYNDGTYTDKLGYSSFTFTGWSLSGGGSISGSTYTFGTSNGTLTAQYSQSAITLPTITRSGYTLKGWYTAASGGMKIGNAGETYRPTGASTDVYAQWEQNAPSIDLSLTSANFSPSNTNWTNQSVIVTVSAPTAVNAGAVIQMTTGSPTVEANWTTRSSITVSEENVTVYARLKYGSKTGAYTSYNVTNIDKTPPREISKGLLTISVDRKLNTAYLQLNSMQEYGNPTASGIAKVSGYFKVEGDSGYTYIGDIDIVPMYGSKRGEVRTAKRIQATSSKITTGTVVYMYAVVWDVAGNSTRTWTARIDANNDTYYYVE